MCTLVYWIWSCGANYSRAHEIRWPRVQRPLSFNILNLSMKEVLGLSCCRQSKQETLDAWIQFLNQNHEISYQITLFLTVVRTIHIYGRSDFIFSRRGPATTLMVRCIQKGKKNADRIQHQLCRYQECFKQESVINRYMDVYHMIPSNQNTI